MEKNKPNNTETGLIVVSVAILAAFIVFMVLNPETTVGGISSFFWGMIGGLGPFFILVAFSAFVISVYLIFSRFGRIRLGNCKPKYSNFSWIAMMILASLASACLYYSLTEWAFYYETPGIGIEPESIEALETSLAFQFYNWGVVNQSLYTIMGIAISYAVYIRKVPSFQTSAVCNAMLGERFGERKKTLLGKVIDFCVIFGILGGLGASLGLAVPLAAGGLKKLFGLEATAPIQIGVILVIALVYIFTSYLGTDKGMKIISDAAAVLCILFLIYVLLLGPTEFILKNTVNTFGKMLAIFPELAFFTDPIRNGGFPEGWSIYFIAFYIAYVPMMGIFIAKISKGRTIREVSLATVLGMTACSWVLFGINGSFSMHTFINGEADVVGLVNSGVGQEAIYSILDVLPLGSTLLPVIMLLLIVGFVAPSMDSASLALAETVTHGGTPSMKIRIFWCVALAVIPLSIILTGSGYDAIKQVAIIISVPFLVILVGLEVGLMKWLNKDNPLPNTDPPEE